MADPTDQKALETAGKNAGPGQGITNPSQTTAQGAVDKNAGDADAAAKKVAAAKKALADAEAEAAKHGPMRETTADEDAKVKAAAVAAKPVVINGRPGGPFSIDGDNFGDAKGEVRVGGRTLPVTRWNNQSIKGTLPADVKAGAVEVVTALGTLSGEFPAKVAPGPTGAVVVTVKNAKGELVQGELVK